MWYDIFSLFYDRALEDLYAPYRRPSIEALRLSEGSSVIDAPCGTGQSLDLLAGAVGVSGSILGVDVSSGMLKKCAQRVRRQGWLNVSLRQVDAGLLEDDVIFAALGRRDVDGILCALGLTAFPNWERDFANLFSLLRPGGRFVILDVHSPTRTTQTRSVELVARADVLRKVWLPLEAACSDFERITLPADPRKFGGELFVAAGTKPSA